MNFQSNKVICIYASSSGNTELVVGKILEILESNSFDVEMHKAENVDTGIFDKAENFILGTSTWEHGELNPYFHKLLSQMKEFDFNGKKAGFVGLGDTRYENVLFCEGMEIIKREFLKNDGTELIKPLKINGEPHEKLDTVVVDWGKELVIELKT